MKNLIKLFTLALLLNFAISAKGQVGLHVFNGTGNYTGAYSSSIDAVIEDNLGAYITLNGKTFTSGYAFADDGNSLRAGMFFITGSLDRISFKTGGVSDRMTITEDGKVGIGTSDPQRALDVNGDMNANDVWVKEVLQMGATRQGILKKTNLTTLEVVFVNLLPTFDNTQNIGSSTQRWKEIFAINGTINTSDRRDKSNIKDLKYGLKEVLKLRPVRFQWKDNKDKNSKLGLIAQDLLHVLPEVVKTHEWEHNSSNDRKPKKTPVHRLGVYYSDIIPVLVSAIQDQQAIIEKEQADKADLKKTLETLQSEVTELKALVNQIISSDKTKNGSYELLLPSQKAKLGQNQPNPFYQSTKVEYFIPEGVQKAFIQVTSIDGKLLKTVNIQEKGNGQVTIKPNSYSAGTYLYTLVLDGQSFETKKMVLTQ